MSRVQLSINVSDFDAAVAFYTRLFSTAPAKLRPGYANFAIDDPPLKLILNSPGNGPGGAINHLGIEVGSTGEVTDAEARLTAVGLAGQADWLRLARLARLLSWLTLAWMGIEGGVAIGAAIAAGSVALLGFGLDSGIEALASLIVIWRFTGARLASATSERRAQQLVAASFFLLAPYIAVEAIHALATGDRAETSIVGLVLTAGTALFEPALGVAKRRIGARLGSSATAGEGTQNLLCAYLAIAVFAGLAANTLLGAWWLDGAVALGIACWAVVEGRRTWAGKASCCGC